jgi:hypothetical protein
MSFWKYLRFFHPFFILISFFFLAITQPGLVDFMLPDFLYHSGYNSNVSFSSPEVYEHLEKQGITTFEDLEKLDIKSKRCKDLTQIPESINKPEFIDYSNSLP